MKNKYLKFLRFRKCLISRKLIFEFFSITFAVFLGLIFSEFKEDLEHKNLVRKARQNIINEIKNNRETIKEFYQKHTVKLQTIDSLKEINEPKGDLKLSINLIFVKDAAWQTCKLSKAITYMNIDEVSELESIYNLQDYYHMLVKRHMKNELSKRYFISKVKEFKYSINKKFNLLKVLIPAEKLLLETYDEMLKDLIKYN